MVIVVRGGFGMVEKAETHRVVTSRTMYISHLGKEVYRFCRVYGNKCSGQRLAYLFENVAHHLHYRMCLTVAIQHRRRGLHMSPNESAVTMMSAPHEVYRAMGRDKRKVHADSKCGCPGSHGPYRRLAK